MTPRQRAFCEYYAACGNGAEAARRAGYSVKTADRIADQNLRKLEIQDEINRLANEMRKRRIAGALERQDFWSRTMRGEESSAEFRDRLRASELLGKAQGDFLERDSRLAIDLLYHFADFVRQHHPEQAPALLEILVPFGTQLHDYYG